MLQTPPPTPPLEGRGVPSGPCVSNSPPFNYSLYTSQQMEAQQKPEGLKRRRWCVPIVQAGVKPLQKRVVTLAPKGRQNVLPPLRGLFTPRLFTGVSPLPVLSAPLRGYLPKMCIKSSRREGGHADEGQRYVFEMRNEK
jgi:hypothetical protein